MEADTLGSVFVDEVKIRYYWDMSERGSLKNSIDAAI